MVVYQKILLPLHQKQELKLKRFLITTKTEKTMDKTKYTCMPCGWTYDPEKGDPENGIAPGTSFDELPDDWTCPVCGVGKQLFDKE